MVLLFCKELNGLTTRNDEVRAVAAADSSLEQSLLSRWLPYVWAFVFFAHNIVNTILPRTDKTLPMRETLRGYHYAIGTVLAILSLMLFIRFWNRRHLPVNEALPALANRWSFSLTMVTLALIVIAPFLGVLSAWADGHIVHFGPLPGFPSLMEENRAVWLFTGYFHAATGFTLLFTMLATMLTAAYFLFRYGQGLFAGFLPGFGLYTLLSGVMSVYAAFTFSGPEPGPMAILIFLAILLTIWGLARIMNRQPDTGGPRFDGKAGFGFIAAIALVIPIGLGMYGPYALFRVSPFQTGQITEAPAGTTSHEAPIVTVQVTPETALEREVREVNFKWCGFCHTFKKDEKHLAGPNLYAIFGREIGKVPNFSYTENFAEHGNRGEVWTDEAMHELLKDPDAFAPGTTMVVSSGNMPDFDRRAALINILKKETMGDRIEEVETLQSDAGKQGISAP